MKCHYCILDGQLRVSASENPLKVDLFVCGNHWAILSNKELALPFMLGRASSYVRDSNAPDKRRALEAYKSLIASMLSANRQ